MVLPGEGSSVAACSVVTAEEESFLPGKDNGYWFVYDSKSSAGRSAQDNSILAMDNVKPLISCQDWVLWGP